MNKKQTIVIIIFVAGLLLCACNSARQLVRNYRTLSNREKALADSIIVSGLHHEALYSIADTLKPMSSIKMYRLPLLSTHSAQVDSSKNILIQLQTVANQLSVGNYQFILNPFERTDSIYKNIELYVVNKKRFASIINQHHHFYSSLGIVEQTNPATVLAITEYEQKYNRWRSYGYLFGYPQYAVDFFVQAGKEQDSTKQFVKRDFFQIPVYASATGHFTYAIPKGYRPTSIDSAIYNKAMITLNRYKKLNTKKPIHQLRKLLK